MDILIGISFFIVYVTGFTIGLTHGKQVQKGITPTINPIKSITQVIEQHTEDKKIKEELTDIMNCTKESMLKAIKQV